METLNDNTNINLPEETVTPTQSTHQQTYHFSKISKRIALVSVWALIGIISVGIFGLFTDKFSNHSFLEFYLVLVFGVVHILWISSIITMLIQKTKKWLRTLNILAPLVLNITLVIGIMANSLLSWEQLSNLSGITWIVYLGISYCALVFPIVVWLINTVVVLSKTLD